MSATSVQTKDVAGVLYELLKPVPDVRVYSYVADTVRVPAVVIGQPNLDFTDQSAGFCRATWLFPLTIITARANDRAAQAEMSRLLLDVVTALGGDTPEWVLSVEPQNAYPTPGVAVNGQELPAYQLNVQVRA